MRRRYRFDRKTHEMVEIPWDSKREALAPAVFGDLPAYTSPIDGRVVDGRKQRREDLKRNNCRPWEGREQERKQAMKDRALHEKKLDTLAEKMAYRAWDMAPERLRKLFRSK
jgi:hypothetical protein